MKLILFILLLSLTSCGLFSPRDSLRTKKTLDLLNSIPITGEGRGRLTVEQRQNVFSFDALLKGESDWVFAASIPLHGEEVMILPNIRENQIQDSGQRSEFERRLIEVLRSQKQWKIHPKDFKQRLRTLVRLLLASRLKQEVKCDSEMCHSEGNIFSATIEKEVFTIEEADQKNFRLLARGKILTDSFFSQTLISLYDTNNEEIFSLELFWK